jgi:hypothetical protein
MEHLRYPNESTEYRAARNALLNDEIALRAQIEAVAAKRRALPPGGKVSEDYVSERIGKNAMPEKVTLSELFGSHDTLILYSFTYGPERELPCPGCTHLLDGIDGAARHMGSQVLNRTSRRVGTRTRLDHLSLVSTAGNHFDIQAAAEALRNYPSPETIEGLFEVSKARGLDGWARGDDTICRLGPRGFKIEHVLEARRVIADSAAPKRISAT